MFNQSLSKTETVMFAVWRKIIISLRGNRCRLFVGRIQCW